MELKLLDKNLSNSMKIGEELTDLSSFQSSSGVGAGLGHNRNQSTIASELFLSVIKRVSFGKRNWI